MQPISRNHSVRAVAIAGAALTATLGGCRDTTPQAPPPPPVEVAEVLVAEVPVFAEYVGQVQSTSNVEVKARVEGFLEDVLFREGTLVEEGQPLFLIEREPVEQRLERARASLADAEAGLDKARTDIERYEPLVEQRAIPRQDLDNARAAERAAVAAVDAAKADVRIAELDLGYTEVLAPVAGLIGEADADIGALVGGFDSARLATLSPLDPIWFDANLSEVEYLEATRRMTPEKARQAPATLILADGTEHPEVGHLVFVDRTVDPTTGTIRVRVEFANPQNRLRPGMYGRLRVLLDMEADKVLIPQRAVQEIQGTYNVYTVDDAGTAHFTRITPGLRIGSLWSVSSGLEPGDRVIVEGLLKARDGAPVTPQPTTIDPAPLEAARALIPRDENAPSS